MTGQAADRVWPSAAPPAARTLLQWQLTEVGELPAMRAQVRRGIGQRSTDPDLVDQLILALDEMASNALRHGGGHVRATLQVTDGGYLIEVSDAAAGQPPTPAVDRDPSQGGLGLYLIARMALRHGWYAAGGAKYVWALLPRS